VRSLSSQSDRYPPIEDYAAIGDGRTVALVSRRGSIDWLPLPDLNSDSIFAAILDADRGGRFVLQPSVPFEANRRYVKDTNVLETTFRTREGVVRLNDLMTLPDSGLPPPRELVRRVEAIGGAVPMQWQVVPRFRYGAASCRLGRRAGVPVADAGADAIAVSSWDAGEAEIEEDEVRGRFEARPGAPALIALSFAQDEPLILPSRVEVEARSQATPRTWRGWTESLTYSGPWRDDVLRSALALKLLLHVPSGAVAAAATTSLPETLGGERNWDYRFSWLRDAAFTIDAFLALGCRPEADAFFWWLLHASQLTHPRLKALYRLDGGEQAVEGELPLAGYRGSRPVRIGNAAGGQVQLDVYGHLLQTAWLYARAAGGLDHDIARRIARTATFVCDIWRQPDSGIWEMRRPQAHFTESKMMCWVALNRAIRLAGAGYVPGRNLRRWVVEADAIQSFIETRCWSEDRRSYVQTPGSGSLDASLLLPLLFGYRPRRTKRFATTVRAVARELGSGPFVYRYRSDDGLGGSEGAFLACSFWLVESLARIGRTDEAASLMEALLNHANDVGLYPEEIDPMRGSFLGNFPQGLTHLSLVSAAMTLSKVAR
jgi:GH15 family glucan-1,4-alpha-glucosidase